jgi:hypothetical protein
MKNIPPKRWTPVRRDASGVSPTLTAFRGATQLLCVAVLHGACVKQLPPAPTPPATVPAVALPPGAAGTGNLVIDVVEGPAPVQRIDMASTPIDKGGGRVAYRFSETPAVLCARSPCVAQVPVGNVLLGFPVVGNDATEVELVHVGPDPSVYRRSLSVYTDNTGGTRVLGIIATAVGGTAMLTGTALLPIGLAKDIDGLTVAGGISLGAGAALLALGIWAIRHDSPTYRPGSSNHFPLAPASP